MSYLYPTNTDLPSLYPLGTRTSDGLYFVTIIQRSDGSLQNVWGSNAGSTASSTAIIKDPISGLALVPDGSGNVTLPNQDEVLLGVGIPTGTPPSGKEIYFDTATGKYYINNNGVWTAGFGGNGALKIRFTQPLVAGNNSITHNFALTTPFTSVVTVRDGATGNLIDHIVNGEGSNSLNLNVGISVASAIVSILA